MKQVPPQSREQTLLTPGTIVTMDPSRRIVRNGGILIAGNAIDRVLTDDDVAALGRFAGPVVAAPGLTAIPGFVQTHLHLCQSLFRGLADDLSLLDWLRLRIFPYESAHNASSMRASALLGISELIASGTTTIMDMGSVHHEDEILRSIDETGIRACAGKAMMDVNDAFPALRETTRDALASALRQAEQWHGSAGGRIRYAVAPRFVLSCTDGLLREAYAMTKSREGMLFHTHACESRQEGEAVLKRCGMGAVEFMESIDVLHANTCLAHCVWLSEWEMDLVARRHAKVLHCPSSNLKLGSGIARVPEMLERGIAVSLGADGAPCNNSLNMFHEMRLASLMQKTLRGPQAMSAPAVFEMATLGGARALGLEREIGSIEAGKKADIVLLDLERSWNIPEAADPYSQIVYAGSASAVRSVIVDGQWLYREGAPLTLETPQIVHTAGVELRNLLRRVQST